MVRRVVSWLRGEPPEEPHVDDDLAVEVSRRQRRVAERLSAVTGRDPNELMDYRRADKILRHHR